MTEPSVTRRELLRRCLQATAAVGLSAGSLALLLRSNHAACSGAVACGQCDRLAGCGLPPAVEARKDMKQVGPCHSERSEESGSAARPGEILRCAQDDKRDARQDKGDGRETG